MQTEWGQFPIAYHRPNNTKKRYVNRKDLAWAPFTNMD